MGYHYTSFGNGRYKMNNDWCRKSAELSWILSVRMLTT